MELSSSNTTKIVTFSQKKAFVIYPEMESCTFQPKLQNKKIHPKKISYISGNRNPEKTSIFSKESFSCTSGNRNPEKKSSCFVKCKPQKKLLIFQQVGFRARKMKTKKRI